MKFWIYFLKFQNFSCDSIAVTWKILQFFIFCNILRGALRDFFLGTMKVERFPISIVKTKIWPNLAHFSYKRAKFAGSNSQFSQKWRSVDLLSEILL